MEQAQIVVKLTGEIAARLGKIQLEIPWDLKSKRPKREILLPHTNPAKDGRPVRSEVRIGIVKAVALGRQWLHELVSGQIPDTEALAPREQRSRRSIHMLISLAFVAPDIIEALIVGRLPRGIGITPGRFTPKLGEAAQNARYLEPVSAQCRTRLRLIPGLAQREFSGQPETMSRRGMNSSAGARTRDYLISAVR
ncbi:MAG: hypothetical protein ABI450_14280 [Rhizomicrobium sp.]